MADSVNDTPVVVDYTSRDFYSLREDLITRVKLLLPRWGGEDSADFGVAMVEAFAYMGDVVNYYVDRVANENYLASATQRQSLINLAKNYGYYPTGFRAASSTVSFTNTSETIVTLPLGTELLAAVTSGDVTFDLIWTLAAELQVPAAVGETLGTVVATVLQYESVARRSENLAERDELGAILAGDIDGELLAVSNGAPEQVYSVLENQVVDGSVRIFIQDGDEYSEWAFANHLTDYGPYDQVFSTYVDANNYVYVEFGDGVSGSIPPRFAAIKTVYFSGGGGSGNISTNLINEFYRVPGLTDLEVSVLADSLTCTNVTAGLGGSAPESNQSIRDKAPLALTALNRAVSLKDYSSLALQVSNAGKARAVAATWTSVTVYVAPQRNLSSVDQFPGYSDNPADGGVLLPEWLTLQQTTQNFFTDKIQIGASVTVSPPTYIPVNISVLYTKQAQYQEVTLDTAVTKVLLDAFAYNAIDFSQAIFPEQIEATLREIPGIINARVEQLYRKGATAGRGVIVAQANELFVALSDDINVAAYSSNANLTTLTTSVGSFTPPFNSGLNQYSLVAPNGTTSVSLTPTVTSSGAAMKITLVSASGTSTVSVGASGVAKTMPTAVGVQSAYFQITAPDNLTVNTYTVTITRNS